MVSRMFMQRFVRSLLQFRKQRVVTSRKARCCSLHVEQLESRIVLSADGIVPFEFNSLEIDPTSYEHGKVLVQLRTDAQMSEVVSLV